MNKSTFKEYLIEILVDDGNELNDVDFSSIELFVDDAIYQHSDTEGTRLNEFFSRANKEDLIKNFKKVDIDYIIDENFLPNQSAFVVSKIKNGKNNIPLSLMLTDCLGSYGLVLSNGNSYMYDLYGMEGDD